MNFLVVGLNHRTAPVDLRESLAMEKEYLPECLERLARKAGQCVVLSTCNRLEVYTLGDIAGSTLRVKEFLGEHACMTETALEPYLYHYQGHECVRHLFRVASGLDSMVVGEQQVLGQVRAAYSAASEGGYVRGPLGRLFHQALRVGRQVQRESDIGRHSRSVSKAAVQLARGVLGDLTSCRSLVVGAGDAGRLVAHALTEAGVRDVTVTNRTAWRAAELAQKLGGTAAPFEDLAEQMAEADVVISSTGSPGYVLEDGMVREAMARRDEWPLLLIDIAVPRDVHPRSGDVPGVQLYDIDALQMVAETGPASLEEDITWAEQVVVDETASFVDWWRSLDVAPLIAAIREQAEEMRRGEVEKTLALLKGRLPALAGEEELEELSARLDAMTSALVKKLLHQPTVQIKDGRDPERQQLVRDLFNVDGKHGQGSTRRTGQ